MAEISGNSKAIRIVSTTVVDTPCCTGVFKKLIILPEREYSSDELHFIVLHEYTHLKNNDFLTKILINTLCALYWWNPLVYLLKKDLNQSMEIRCDCAVAQTLNRQQRADYLAVMLNEFKRADEARVSRNGKALELRLFGDRDDKLVERFRLVADDRHTHKHGKALAWVITAFLLVASYSFIVQTQYDAPQDEIETDMRTYEVDRQNSCIVRQVDGTFMLRTNRHDIPISEESAKELLNDGFEIVGE